MVTLTVWHSQIQPPSLSRTSKSVLQISPIIINKFPRTLLIDKSNYHSYVPETYFFTASISWILLNRKKPPINTHTVAMSKLGLYLKLLAAYELPPPPPPRSSSK